MRRNALKEIAADLSISSQSSYHLLPSLVARTGPVAIAALLLTPLAALAARRRWSALVLGGMVLLLALELSSVLFPRFSDLVSLSQSRRAMDIIFRGCSMSVFQERITDAPMRARGPSSPNGS